jgi:hypothetical protein
VEEDSTLVDAVTEFGKNWAEVAALVPGRTNVQCRRRWVDSLVLDINTDKWTVEEDAPLTEAVWKHGNNWAEVAVMVPGRTKNQCRRGWVDSLDPDINTGKWTVVEDATLIGTVTINGVNNWAAVAALVLGRTNNCCRLRWVKYLDPTIDLPASPDGTVAVAPNDAATVGGRSLLRAGTASAEAPRRNRNGNWSPEEDAKLTEAVAEKGKDWVRVAVLVPGRTNDQCRPSWVRHFGP